MEKRHELAKLLHNLRNLRPVLSDRYGVETIGVFGSYVREQQRPDSDLDLLVTFRETPSLLQFIELENFLADHLGVKVDLVMESALKPTIRKHILQEIQSI